MKKSILITVLIICTNAFSQEFETHKIPEWFVKNMQDGIGKWVTDNKEYTSEGEPMTKYVMEWKYGIGNKSITGIMYGLIGEKKTQNFWEFRQYWDFEKNQGILEQYSFNGTMGKGPMKLLENGEVELIQTFTSLYGDPKIHGHRSITRDNEFTTKSYNVDEKGEWTKDRSYVWYKEVEKKVLTLGEFSISLNVKNLTKSLEFYQKLGFEKTDGNIDHNWLILKNGDTKIGLFQGMFPQNTITFNPTTNARELHKKAIDNDLKIMMSTGMDNPKGACSFMLVDPDGNPILVDQH